MKFGELSNKPSPRLVLVYEGVLADVPVDSKTKYDKLVSKGDWFQAMRLYSIHTIVMSKLLDLTWRINLNINLVTYLSEDAAFYIGDQMDFYNIPVRGCFYSSPQDLAKALPFNPDIVAVCDPDPDHVLLYGSRGVLFSDISSLGKMYG